jgi:hypothetical protein
MQIIGRVVATLSLCLLAATAWSQSAKVDVTFSHVGADAWGKRLAAAFRNELMASKRMRLVSTSSDRIGIYLVTTATGNGTAYSATWTLGGMTDDGYLTSKVGLCASEAIRPCVRSLLAETDKHAMVLYSVRHQATPAR